VRCLHSLSAAKPLGVVIRCLPIHLVLHRPTCQPRARLPSPLTLHPPILRNCLPIRLFLRRPTCQPRARHTRPPTLHPLSLRNCLLIRLFLRRPTCQPRARHTSQPTLHPLNLRNCLPSRLFLRRPTYPPFLNPRKIQPLRRPTLLRTSPRLLRPSFPQLLPRKILPASLPRFHPLPSKSSPHLILVYVYPSVLMLDHLAHLEQNYSTDRGPTESPTLRIPLTHAPMDPEERIMMMNPST